jgi:hypothetical protein
MSILDSHASKIVSNTENTESQCYGTKRRSWPMEGHQSIFTPHPGLLLELAPLVPRPSLL